MRFFSVLNFDTTSPITHVLWIWRYAIGGTYMAELWDILDENGKATGRVHERGKPMNKGKSMETKHRKA